MSLLWKACLSQVPHLIVAPVIPVVSFYAFTFILILEGWTTMGIDCVWAYRSRIFWLAYVLPVSLLIGTLGYFMPKRHEAIDWASIAILFFGLYLLSPRIY